MMPKLRQTGHLNREQRRIESKNLAGWKVLIVDDQPDNIRVAQIALNFHGAEVQTAKNGKEGLKMLARFSPTLVLLDLSMPEMNGWEMFKAIRAKPEYKKLPVIALTAHAMEGDRESVMKAGFTGYIPKPFSVITIIDDIKACLQAFNENQQQMKRT